MWIKQLTIHDYRAFQEETTINLNKNLTLISGLNGVGKSTILAVLTNVGELKGYKLLNGKKFRGEFSNVIMYDSDHDTSGEKAKIIFEDLPTNLKKYNVTEELKFRAAIQTRTAKNQRKYKRYRLLPKANENKKNSSKIVWPSYYMGLSRLVPLGEYDLTKSQHNIIHFQQEMLKVHMDILNENLDNVKFANLDIGTNYPKATISSSTYGNASNSNGQDNLGQIIEAVFSFKKLKEDYPDYIGGILAIDELDASLHPAAQNNLIDWLIEISKELNLQIVVTTHSLSMLQHVCDIRKTNKKDSITINYLIRQGNKINIIQNQPFSFYKNTLRETYEKMFNTKINVFTEDETARWFIREAMQLLNYDDKKLNFLEVNISWSHLLNLLNADYDNFSNYIFILDGDIKNNIVRYMKEHAACNFNFDDNPNKSDILCLPCDQPIEKKLFDYVNNLPDDDKLFSDPYMLRTGIVNKSIIEKFTDETRERYPKDDEQKTIFYKHWFKDERHQKYMNIFLRYWIRDNEQIVKKFLDSIKAKVGQISSKNNLLY